MVNELNQFPPIGGNVTYVPETFPPVGGNVSYVPEAFPPVGGNVTFVPEAFPPVGGSIAFINGAFPPLSGSVTFVPGAFPRVGGSILFLRGAFPPPGGSAAFSFSFISAEPVGSDLGHCVFPLQYSNCYFSFSSTKLILFFPFSKYFHDFFHHSPKKLPKTRREPKPSPRLYCYL